MDARDTSMLFSLAGILIIVIQVGLIGKWSKLKGDRWLVMMGLGALAVGLIGTALTGFTSPLVQRGKSDGQPRGSR